MKCTILSIGTELSLGLVLDTNSRFIAEHLADCGIECNFIHIIRDNDLELCQAIQMSLEQSDILILNGGLGPTDDDITRLAVAQALGLKLKKQQSLDPTSLKFIKKIKSNHIRNRLLKQSYIPEGAVGIKPRLGSASGFYVQHNQKWIFCIPGVPREMQDMFMGDVLPRLKKLSGYKRHATDLKMKVLMTTDISETEIEIKIKDLIMEANQIDLNIGITANPGLIKIILIAKEQPWDVLNHFENTIKERLQGFVYGTDDPRIGLHLKNVAHGLHSKIKICTVESITGGLMGSMITDIPGSSDYYAGGIICYSNFSKNKILGIDEKMLNRKGAVSREVCLQMSQKGKKIFDADYAVAVTGYAGPADKDAGLVYYSITGPQNAPEVTKKKFLGTREDIKFRTAQAALNKLRVLIGDG